MNRVLAGEGALEKGFWGETMYSEAQIFKEKFSPFFLCVSICFSSWTQSCSQSPYIQIRSEQPLQQG